MDLVLRQGRLPAAEASQAGLVAEVVPDGQALPTALTWAEEFRTSPRGALAAAKQLANAAALADLDAALARESLTQSRLLLSADHAEGVAAFLERRPAVFPSDAG